MRLNLAAWLLLILPLSAQRFSTAQRQADLNYVAMQVPALDVNFFAQLSLAACQQAAAALQAQISTLTDAQFYVQLSALIAMAGNAHTTFYLANAAAQNPGFSVFPLQFRWLDDGIFVTSATASYAQALGTQLVRVGNVPINQVVQMLGTIIPHANDQWLHYQAQQYLRGQQYRRATPICCLIAGDVRNSAVDRSGTGHSFGAGGRCRVRERTSDALGRGAGNLRGQ